MDWIQIYFTIWLTLSCVVNMFFHGSRREGCHDFRWWFAGVILALPYIGRVYEWW